MRITRCTVVIPAYNCERTIGDTLESVMGQTLQDIEIVVVDDCSLDGTLSIIKDLSSRDNRIRYFQNSENKRVAATRNRGVAEAKSEWIAFLDADDTWHSDKLEKQLLIAESEEADLVYTGAYFMDDSGAPTGGSVRVPERTDYAILLRGNDIICSSVLVKTSLLIEHPMERYDLHEDYICWLSILRDGAIARGINEPLVGYRLTAGSKSRNKWKSAVMMWKSYGLAGVIGMNRVRYFLSYVLHGLKRYINCD